MTSTRLPLYTGRVPLQTLRDFGYVKTKRGLSRCAWDIWTIMDFCKLETSLVTQKKKKWIVGGCMLQWVSIKWILSLGMKWSIGLDKFDLVTLAVLHPLQLTTPFRNDRCPFLDFQTGDVDPHCVWSLVPTQSSFLVRGIRLGLRRSHDNSFYYSWNLFFSPPPPFYSSMQTRLMLNTMENDPLALFNWKLLIFMSCSWRSENWAEGVISWQLNLLSFLNE